VDAWIIILIVVAVFALLAVGGALAQRRRLEATRPSFERHLDAVNTDLAEAHAADRGWDPDRLTAAARAAWREHGAGAPGEPTLVEVVDPPGTEDDKAVFEIRGTGRARRLTLGRRGDDWRFEGLD
jgi:hypothetical protein